ncbi:MAG: hypothetical protein GX352_08645 [Clostridiales bacterium]|nr:hypothetical protein [Clostridiales bacterium]
MLQKRRRRIAIIIHSIVPIEQIYPTDQKETVEHRKIITFNNIQMEVRFIDERFFEIQRIFSTDLRDYLKPELQPGTRMGFDIKTN